VLPLWIKNRTGTLIGLAYNFFSLIIFPLMCYTRSTFAHARLCIIVMNGDAA